MNLQVGVKVLIKNDSDQFLMLRRAQAFDHGGEQVWDIPGGRIDSEEGLFDALNREVLEETALTLESEPQPQLIAAQDIFVSVKDFHVVRLTYVGTATGEIKLSEEHDEYK